MPKKQDLTGKIFGRLQVLREIPERKNGRILWHCRCECGNEVDVIGASLTKKTSPTRSCGCLQREKTKQANTPDLIGQKFGRLTVLKRSGKGWMCQCECGGSTITTTTHLKTGHTKSCGCLQKESATKTHLVDYTGEIFGKLTVLERVASKNTRTMWKCQCDCGNIIEVAAANLQSGSTLSCGCLRISHGEYKIRELLNRNNIKYQTEYMFDTCRNPKTNRPLRFDFYVEDKYLIEFDGKQHFEQGRGWLSQESLEEIQYRDNIKNQWCKENNIPLIRIPYTKLNNLSIEDLKLPKPAQPTV